jgi:hypothetical protein
MTFREMNLRVFRRQPLPHVLFQPRFEPWYDWQVRFGDMPQRYRDMGIRTVYDELGCSMRYVDYYTGAPSALERSFSSKVKIRMIASSEERIVVYETPYGELAERSVYTVDETWREVSFPVKDRDDLRKLRWLAGEMSWEFSRQRFQVGDRYIGECGYPQFYLPKSPYQALAQQWMKLQDLVYALADCPDEVEATMQAIDDSHDSLYAQLAANTDLVKIVNFGENMHDHLFSRRYLERYILPWYARRAGQLREAGIYSHMHLDGYFHSILKYLKEMPFDGIEALTPSPQGDVTLEEMKEHIGDKILLDGIPAVYFMAPYTRDDLMACVEQCVRLFHPRLVLGVSDEVPEGAPSEEAIARIKMVADYSKAQAEAS